jgi:deazaflavin-dependent oxidoreductase (nitroreductase family)
MGWVLDLADRTWPVTRRLMAGHTAIYRATGGRIGHTLPVLRQNLLLDHVGAKSGVKRTTPLLYVEDGDTLVIVASKGGYPKHPAWLHNLRAHPETTVQVRGDRRAVRAREATDEERPRLWEKAVALYPGYRDYQARSRGRTIPIVVLEPR